MRVLIIDDNAAARFLLREMLETHGLEVVAEAEDLNSALTAYRTHKPHRVTLDLSLEHGDGIEILKALRQLDPKAEVFIISANAQNKIKQVALSAGASGFLTKPVQAEELIALFARA